MKKLFLVIALLSCCGFLNLNAQEKFRYENTTWWVIRERLFDGTNSKAFRYEEDIRIQLKGYPSHEDSTLLDDLVKELKPLIEIVDIKIVDQNANFIINITRPDLDNFPLKYEQKTDGYNIKYTELNYNSSFLTNHPEEKRGNLEYLVVRHLTKLFIPKKGKVRYGGIFDDIDKPVMMPTLNDLDKDLINKLYSKNFYQGLRENTTKQISYLSYLDLRYHHYLTYISTLLGIVLSILGFFYLVLNQSYTSSEIKYGGYLKKGVVILFGISVIYPSFTLSQILSSNYNSKGLFFFFIANMFQVFFYGFIIITLMFLLERFIKQKIVDFKQRQFLFFISTTFSILLAWFITSQIALFLYFKFSVYLINLIKVPLLFNFSILIVAIIVSSLRVFFNFLNYRIQSMVNQKDVELAKMKELKNQAELNALHSRINPHFLYNSLNSIAGLAHSDPDKTENMATSLSELFRYSINKEDKTYVSVEDELEMVRKYLEIEKVRFGEKLDYQIEIGEETRQKPVPKFLIQPLVENAVKHGLSQITAKGILKVAVEREGDDLTIRVYDNGPNFPQELISGYGLQNLYDKLKILYGEGAILNWQNGKNKHIQITLKNQFRP